MRVMDNQVNLFIRNVLYQTGLQRIFCSLIEKVIKYIFPTIVLTEK